MAIWAGLSPRARRAVAARERGRLTWSRPWSPAHLLVGDPVSGLDSVTEALHKTRRTGLWYMESELQRLRGEVLQAAGAEAADIAAAFRLAHDIGQRQQAKALELRAAVAFTRWRVAQGAEAEKVAGLRMLESAYRWFTEGHDTPDLIVARQLIADLS